MNKLINKQTNGQKKSPYVLQDFVPLKGSAHKANLELWRTNLRAWKQTRLDTWLPKSRVGWQQLYLRSLDCLGRSRRKLI